MSAPAFTPQEATALIQLVQSAPLQNMQHAAAVSSLLQKFQTWYDYVNLPPPPASDA